MQNNCERKGGAKYINITHPPKLLKLSVNIRNFHKFQDFNYLHKFPNIYILTMPQSNKYLMGYKMKMLKQKIFSDIYKATQTPIFRKQNF